MDHPPTYVVKIIVPSNSQKILFGVHCLLKNY